MQRVIFTGDDLTDFPEDYESGYVKLFFSTDGQAMHNKNQVEQAKYLRRTYTVRSFSREDNELGLEFSLHSHGGGPASTWAESAKPGDKILMDGPGPTKLVNNESDWFLLAGDMAGLPALCCNLEQLPKNAQGYAVIEVISEVDKQTLNVPDGLDLKWVVNNQPGANSDALVDEIKTLPWKDGNPYIWVACEFDSMKKIRHYLKDSRNVDPNNLYISSYWKFDRTEEQHRIDKQIDAGAPSFIQFLWNVKANLQKLSPLKK